MKRRSPIESPRRSIRKRLKLPEEDRNLNKTEPAMVDQRKAKAEEAVASATSLPMKSFYGRSTKAYTPPQERPHLLATAAENKPIVKRERKRTGSAVKSAAPIDKKPAVEAVVTEAKENSPKKSPTKKRFFKHRNSSPTKKSRAVTGVSVQLHKGFKVQVNLKSKKESPPKERKLMENTVVLNSGSKSILDVIDSKSLIQKSPIQKSPIQESRVSPKLADSGCDSENITESKSVLSWGTDSNISNESVDLLSEVSFSVAPSPSKSEVPLTPVKQKKIFPIFDSFRRSPRLKQKSSQSTPNRKSPKQILKKIRDKDGMEQMTLDVGQRLIGAIQCEGCGMTYTHGEPTDEATHVKFHQRLLSALKFPGWKNERVVQEYYEGSRILVVLPHEKLFMKKVNAIRVLMDEDLGFVVENKNLLNSKSFLYISPDQQVVACCVAEIITQGYRVLSPDCSPMKSPNSTLPRPWCCSNDPEPARCGINRVWVLSSQRRQGIATRLLDAVRNHFIMGNQLSPSDLAFTDPTPTGKLLASTYCQTSQFLVYKHGGH